MKKSIIKYLVINKKLVKNRIFNLSQYIDSFSENVQYNDIFKIDKNPFLINLTIEPIKIIQKDIITYIGINENLALNIVCDIIPLENEGAEPSVGR